MAPQHRCSETSAGSMRSARRTSCARCCSARRSAEPIDSPTPCRLTGYAARALQRAHRGATIEKEVLAVDLDEPQFWHGLEDLAVVRLTKANTEGRQWQSHSVLTRPSSCGLRA